MSKSLSVLFSLIALMITVSTGCSHKPAYSEIDANRTVRNQNQAGEAQAASQAPAPEAPQAATSQPAPSTAEPETFKMPSFVNSSGAIKDLPSYPKATRVNMQIGPIQQAYVMTLLLHTKDSMEKVQAFYTQSIKENQWTVSD